MDRDDIDESIETYFLPLACMVGELLGLPCDCWWKVYRGFDDTKCRIIEILVGKDGYGYSFA